MFYLSVCFFTMPFNLSLYPPDFLLKWKLDVKNWLDSVFNILGGKLFTGGTILSIFYHIRQVIMSDPWIQVVSQSLHCEVPFRSVSDIADLCLNWLEMTFSLWNFHFWRYKDYWYHLFHLNPVHFLDTLIILLKKETPLKQNVEY